MTTNLKALPSELDLVLYSGDGVTIAFAFTEDGQPWSTAGEWTAEVRASTVGPVITSFAIDNTAPETGVVKASLTGAQVRSLGNGAVYDLQHVAPGAEPRTWYRGTITVTGDVSRG